MQMHPSVSMFCRKPLPSYVNRQDLKAILWTIFLRAIASTRLYDAEVDEQLNNEKNGHISSAVRLYKRTKDAQHVKISEIIQGIEIFKCESEDADKKSKKKFTRCGDFSVCVSESRELYIEHNNLSFKLKF